MSVVREKDVKKAIKVRNFRKLMTTDKKYRMTGKIGTKCTYSSIIKKNVLNRYGKTKVKETDMSFRINAAEVECIEKNIVIAA